MRDSFVWGIIIIMVLVSLFISIYAEVNKPGYIDKEGKPDISKINMSESALSRQIDIPASWQNFFRFIFGVSGTISFAVFIVLLALFVMVFILIQIVMEMMPFFGEGWPSWVGGFIACILISMSGGFYYTADFFFWVGNFFGMLEKWPIAKLIAAFAIVFVLFLGFLSVIGRIREKMELEEAGIKGEKVGKVRKLLDIISRAYSKN